MSAQDTGGSRRTVIEGAHIATVDAAGTEHPAGHIVFERGLIAAVGAGRRTGRVARGRGRSSTPPAAWSRRASSTRTTTSTSG